MDFEDFKDRVSFAVTRHGKGRLGLSSDDFCPLGCMTVDHLNVYPRPTPYMCMLYLGLDILAASSFMSGYDGALHRGQEAFLPYFELGRQYRHEVLACLNPPQTQT